MTGKGGAGRVWAVWPILFLTILAIWPENTVAQSPGGLSDFVSTGVPASGPSAQLFNSASSVLFSPPPPSVVTSPVAPPPPSPSPSPSPSPIALSPPPPVSPPPPPNPPPASSPPPSPTFFSPPPPASTPPPPSPPARATPSPTAATTSVPASPPPIISTPGTTSSPGTNPTSFQQLSPPSPPTVVSPTLTPPAVPASPSPPPPLPPPSPSPPPLQPPPAASPPPAVPSPPPPQPTPPAAPMSPPPAAPSPPPPTPAPTFTPPVPVPPPPNIQFPPPEVQASPPASRTSPSTPGTALGTNSNETPAPSLAPSDEVRNSISSNPSPPGPPPNPVAGQGAVSTPGVLVSPSPPPNSAASPVPTPPGTALGNVTNTTTPAFGPSSGSAGSTQSPPGTTTTPPARTPTSTSSSTQSGLPSLGNSTTTAPSTATATPTASAASPRVSAASTTSPSSTGVATNSTGSALSAPGVTNVTTPGVNSATRPPSPPVSTAAPARAPATVASRDTAVAPAAAVETAEAPAPDDVISASSTNRSQAVAPAPSTSATNTSGSSSQGVAPAPSVARQRSGSPAQAPTDVAANAIAPDVAPAANITAPRRAPAEAPAANATSPARAPAAAPAANVTAPARSPAAAPGANATAPAAAPGANVTAPAPAPGEGTAANASVPASQPVASSPAPELASAPAPAPVVVLPEQSPASAPAPAPMLGTSQAPASAPMLAPDFGRAPAPAPGLQDSGTPLAAVQPPAPAPGPDNAVTVPVTALAPSPAELTFSGPAPSFSAPEAGFPEPQAPQAPGPSFAVSGPSPDDVAAFSVAAGPGFGPSPRFPAPEADAPDPQAPQAPSPSPSDVAAFSTLPGSNFTASGPAPGPVLGEGPAPGEVQDAEAPAPAPGSALALPTVTGLSPQSSPESSPAQAPQSLAALAPGFPPLSILAPAPGPGLGLATLETFNGPAPAPASAGAFGNSVAYASSALPPSLEGQRQFYDGSQTLAPSPGTPSWLSGAQEIGTDLYYVSSGSNSGFYTVVQQEDGTTATTYAFATVPSGSNVSNLAPNNVELGLQGYEIYPFNETYQAALMNQLHVALDDAGVSHTMYFNSTTNVTNPSSATTGRRLLQSNPDNITSTVGSNNQTATLQVTTQDNVQVSVIVSVPPNDRNNLTAIVDNAITSGQVRRGLQEAGANVTNATVTGVSAIQSGVNGNLSPGSSNTAAPASQSGGLSGGVIGGAVGGGCAAVAILGFLLYKLHSVRMKKRQKDIEASPAARLTDSSSEEGYPYHRRNGKYSSNGTSESDDRPYHIKTMKGGMQDITLLSSGYTGSMDYSPYAHSVQPRSGEDRSSPQDSPQWEEYRQSILTGIEKAASKHHQASHKIDANLWQVHWNEIQLQHKIGGGSFGKVHLAKWRETTVAVKILSGGSLPEDSSAPVSHAMLMALQKEASMMAAMRHPNIVMYIGVCLEVPALVTEYCARGSLHDVLRKWSKRPDTAVSWSRRIGMVLDAAKGMNYLHSSDPPVIHRDLKSPNLLVDKHWTVKICDFNLSRAIEESGGNVASSLAATNPRWLAPEILSGKGYSFSSDVYSFGMILWEVLTWTVPWNDVIHWQVVHMVTEQKARPEIPSEESLPGGSFSGFAEYTELVKSCWDQDPEARPKFPQIIEVLRRLMATEAGHGRQDGRSSSLGTDQISNSGFLSYGPSTLNNGTSLGHSHEGTSSSHQGASLGPSQAGTSLDRSHVNVNEIILIPLEDEDANNQKTK